MTRLLWRMLSILGRERDGRVERAIAGERGAVRRLAALVAGGAAPAVLSHYPVYLLGEPRVGRAVS